MAFRIDRRRFLHDSAIWAVAGPALPGVLSGVFTDAEAVQEAAVPSELVRGFLDPPDSARPWVYYMVMDGTLTREGITADLEAMHRVGIGGLLYMEVDQFVPKGPVRFLSPQWRQLYQHMVREASRLGITINMNNDAGYAGSGGPWVTPELSMQMLVWSETTVQGPSRISRTLLQPKTIQAYYRDIAVLAFPTPSAERVRMADYSPRFTYGLDRKKLDGTKLTDGDLSTTCLVPAAEIGQPQYLNMEFAEPFTAQSLTVALDPWNSEATCALEVSDDGRNFRMIRPFALRWPASSVNFPKVTSRFYRLSMKGPSEDVDWLFRVLEKGFPLGAVELHSSPRVEDIPGKAAYIRQEVFSGEPESPPELAIRNEQVLDLTDRMDGNGHLTWDAPPGHWTVLRIGHTSTGKMNHPSPEGGMGLECDKLSKKAIEVHFAGLMEKLLQDQAAIGGNSLKMTHIDSWETGSQNWTPGFREEFRKRRGYDLLRYLPVLTGRAVEDSEVTERFLWDLRRTVADLMLENYAEHLREISHGYGLTLSIEAYGGGPFADVAFGGRADVPMAEFWTGYPAWWDRLMGWCKAMASSAHLYGRPILMAESFTAEPQGAKWQNHPYQLKALGDLAFTLGINRLVFHRYAMQPWVDRKPGMTMGAFGIHHERTNTWWEQSRAWHQYLARCQYVLQQGQFVADVAYLGSEGSPHSFPKREQLDPAIPPGYDFDGVPPEILLSQMSVRDGRLVSTSGMSYRVLVLPPGRTMTPALLAKIKQLVTSGLTVVGAPPERSPSLSDYPRCDEDVRAMAAEIWGECDGINITENRFGMGKVVWGKPLAEVLLGLDASPDFACRDVTVGEHIRYIHRTHAGDDLYFVSSAAPAARRFLCTFRVRGKRPELWWPDTGRIEPVAVYEERGGTTVVPLQLDPLGSVFVVFRSADAEEADPVVSVRHNNVEGSGLPLTPVAELQLEHECPSILFSEGKWRKYKMEVDRPGSYVLRTAQGRILKAEVSQFLESFEITGLWELRFPKGWGAPESVTLERLISWPDHPDPGVKYFSGTATYHRTFDVSRETLREDRKLHLDLGHLAVIAEVQLNGRDFGILWKPPFRVEITGGVRAGANELVVKVVNLWPNRLIGDAHLLEDCEWQPPATPANLVPKTWGDALYRLPQWLLDGKASPTGRYTFTTWKHWTKDHPLLESGLLGPVRILATRQGVLSP